MATDAAPYERYNGYAITVWDGWVLKLSCEACGRQLLALPSAYLSYLARTADTHTQLCGVVNSQGRHSLVH